MGDAHGTAARDGANVHDRSGPVACDPLPRRRLHHIPGPVEVRFDHRSPAFGRDIDGGQWELASGVVDDEVDSPLLIVRSGEQLGHLLGVADGRLHGLAADAELAQ